MQLMVLMAATPSHPAASEQWAGAVMSVMLGVILAQTGLDGSREREGQVGVMGRMLVGRGRERERGRGLTLWLLY